MSTDIVPVVMPTEEENRPTEVEQDSSDSTAPVMPLTKHGGTILNKMVSGNDHEPKTSVDYIMSGMSEMKQMLKQILNTLQPLPSQVGQAALDTKICSTVTELHEKVQQISGYCAAASVKEKENWNIIAKQQAESENVKKQLEEKRTEIKKRYDDDLKKLDEEKLYKKELEKYKEKVEEYRNEAQQYKEEVIEYKTQLKYCRGQEQHHKNVSEQREEDNKRYQNRQQEYIKQIEELKSENKILKGNIEELKSKTEKLKGKNEELKCKNEEFKSEFNEKANSYATEQEKAKQTDIEKLKEINDELKKELYDKETEIARLNCDLASLRSSNEGQQKLIDYQKKDVDHHRYIQVQGATKGMTQVEEIKEETESTTVTYRRTTTHS